MPGLSVKIKFNDKPDLSEEKFKSVQESLLHTADYSIKQLIKSEKCYAVFSGYKEYPLNEFNYPDIKIFIEGKVYNKSRAELNSSLFSLTEMLTLPDPATKIKSWLQEVDGDFVIFIWNKKLNKYFILNDILGRLPFYIYKDRDSVIISREMKFLFKQIPEKEIETYGVAETLLLGYPLGEKTLLKNISRISPASLITIEPEKSICTLKRISEFNFETKEHEKGNIDDYVQNLYDLFLEGTKNRFSKHQKNVLSLSGGFDSRSVLGALKILETDFNAVTFSGYSKSSFKDAEVAKNFSEKFNFSWELIELPNPSGQDLKNLLYFKDGTNILWQSFLVIYYNEVMKKYGRDITFFTGDGGDKVFPDHRSAVDLPNVRSLVKYIVSNKHFFTPRKIAELLSINEKEFLDHLANHFSSYPEVSPNYKYLRFIMMERGIKWLFETEDKNRFFFWTAAPMYSYPFFNYAMNIPDNFKTGYSLYYKFLSKINPQSLQYKHATLNVSLNPDSLKYKGLIFAKDKLYPKLPSFIKRLLRMRLTKIDLLKINDNQLLNSLINDLLKDEYVSKYFDKSVVKNLGSINKVEFYILLTQLSSIEYYFNNKSIFSNFMSEEFP